MKKGNTVQATLCKRENKENMCWDAALGCLPQDIQLSRVEMWYEWLNLRSLPSHQLGMLPLVLSELGSSYSVKISQINVELYQTTDFDNYHVK